MTSARLACGLVLSTTLMAGCTPPSPPTAVLPQATNLPTAIYQRALADGKAVFQIASAESIVTIIARRGGPLARFGHDHVVASRSVSGYAIAESGRADLIVPLADLSVDEAALRTQAGLDTQPSAADIAGTRSNMLDKVLEVARFPIAQMRIDAATTTPAGHTLSMAITLHGTLRTLQVPVRIDNDGRRLRVVGTLQLRLSAFGIAPFAILGGAVRLEDEVNLSFDLRAHRLTTLPLAS